MIIDSHQHVFWHGRDDAGLVRDMDEHHVDLAWLLSWEIGAGEYRPEWAKVLNPEHVRADGTHPGIPLGDLLRARDRYPDRFAVGYCPHPTLAGAAERFEAAVRMHGVTVCGEWKFRTLINDPRSLELFHAAGELGCPVVLHLDAPFLADPEGGRPAYQPHWYGGSLDALEACLAACPKTQFIGHAPGFWRYISRDAETDPEAYPSGPVVDGGRLCDAFGRYPNLFADLSAGSGLRALRRDMEYAQRFCQRFADRLLFGRDIYGGELQELLDQLTLDDTARASIMCGNAQRLRPVPSN